MRRPYLQHVIGEFFVIFANFRLTFVSSSNHDVTCETPSVQISWSGDGTQVAGACGNGQVIFAHVIEKRIEWRDYEATVTGRKTISLRNVTNDAWEKLEFRDRIIQVTTCFIINMETMEIFFNPIR